MAFASTDGLLNLAVLPTLGAAGSFRAGGLLPLQP